MYAVRVHEGGRLAYEEVPDPTPGPGEILVELKAASLNRRDLLVRNPPAPTYDFPKPFVAGHDGAGVRRDTGEEVVLYPAAGWRDVEPVPDELRFLGGPLDGTFAELVAVSKENVFPKPARLTFEEAATLPVAGLTAYRALIAVGLLRAGETALVLGSGSGVSTFAVSMAAQVGVRVLVTSSSDEKIERARALGADAGVLYTREAWTDRVLDLTGGAGVDLVLDAVGSTWKESLRCLRKGGRLVVMGATGGSELTLDVRSVYLNWLSILGTTLGSPRELAEFLELVQVGDWRPVVDSGYPLADAEAAYERLRGDHFGKIVLRP